MNDEYAKIAVLESQIEELRRDLTQTKIALDIARDGSTYVVSHIRFGNALKEDTLENRIWHMVHNWCMNTNPTIPDMARRYLMDAILDIVQDQKFQA